MITHADRKCSVARDPSTVVTLNEIQCSPIPLQDISIIFLPSFALKREDIFVLLIKSCSTTICGAKVSNGFILVVGN